MLDKCSASALSADGYKEPVEPPAYLSNRNGGRLFSRVIWNVRYCEVERMTESSRQFSESLDQSFQMLWPFQTISFWPGTKNFSADPLAPPGCPLSAVVCALSINIPTALVAFFSEVICYLHETCPTTCTKTKRYFFLSRRL